MFKKTLLTLTILIPLGFFYISLNILENFYHLLIRKCCFIRIWDLFIDLYF